jgi:hypothetical protein
MENALAKTDSIELVGNEQSQLKKVESVIEQTLGSIGQSLDSIGRSMFLVGESFQMIRDQKLWRSGYVNFEDYVKKRWNWTGAYASELITAYEIKMALPESVRDMLKNEGQANALRLARPEERADVLIEVSADGIITAKRIMEAIEMRDRVRIAKEYKKTGRLPPPPPPPPYGKKLEPPFRGLANEPVNENGVVFLFGLVAKDLGFTVKLVQAPFPDCWAERTVLKERETLVKIEFEFESRNFLYHGHDPNGCDIIVCWEDNWPDHPSHLEVIALKEAIKSLPS